MARDSKSSFRPVSSTQVSRRAVLAATGSVLLVPGARSVAAPVTPRGREPDRARNVIFMVSDGMSTGTLTLAHLARQRRGERGSHWVQLWNRAGVRRASATTHAADSLVTDSAAGASAWGIGTKVPNGSINIEADGRQHVPILVHARQAVKATGLVTTTRVTHATPAGFATNAPARSLESMIAEQLLERGIDVILGGGAKHFPAELLARYPDRTVVRSAAELRAAAPTGKAKRLLGLFGPDHLPFELDRLAKAELRTSVPTLAEMTAAALKHLSGEIGAEGFVLQIEGGRVDHAAHSNDAAALIGDQIAFDDAVATVLEFTKGRDDTLVIITSDHGNANPGLTLYGKRAEAGMSKVLSVKGSFELIEERAAQMYAATNPPAAPKGTVPEGYLNALISAMGEVSGVELGADDQRLISAARRGQRAAGFKEMNNWGSMLGQVLANHFGVSFVSPNHTGDMVEVTAFGPGSAAMPAFLDNTDLHGLMVRALKLPAAELLPGMEKLIKMRPAEDAD